MKLTTYCADGLLVKILGLFWSKKLSVEFSHVYFRYQDTH